MKIILASGSTKRAELLQNNGVIFEQISSDIEEIFSKELSIEQNLINIAISKSEFVLSKTTAPPDCIISADTVVLFKDKILGKPASKEEAKSILNELSDNIMDVTTGFCVMMPNLNKKEIGIGNARIYFKPLSSRFIEQYVESGKGMNKAGAYGMESKDDENIEIIEGTIEDVQGFPINKILDIMRNNNILS